MDRPGRILAQRMGLSPCRPWVDGDGMLVESMEVFWEVDGNKDGGLGFLKRGGRVRDSFSRRETPLPLMELDSKWVTEAVVRRWASLELAQVRPTYRWGHVFERYNGPTCPFGLYGSF